MKRKQHIKIQKFLLYLPAIAIYYILYLFFASNTYAQSEVYLSVRAGGSGLYGIGIGGFESSGSSSAIYAVRNTLTSDLVNSGLFEVKTLPDSLAKLPENLFERWKTAGAKYYLLGEERDNGNSVRIKLFDLKTAATVLHETYRIDKEKSWYTAHVIVDDMIEIITGIRGSMASQIVYIHAVRDSKELFVIDADGRNPHQLTFSGKYNLSPCWSPDGNNIAYTSLNDTNWNIMTININTGQSVTVSRWADLILRRHGRLWIRILSHSLPPVTVMPKFIPVEKTERI